jgi:two-component system, OmpR family, sensor histidine kinase BaeS
MALIGMVVFMSIVFTFIALTSTQALLGHAETYVQQAYGDRINQLLSVYYEGHKSWNGVQDYINKELQPNDPTLGRAPKDYARFLVFDQTNKVVVDPSTKDLGNDLSKLPTNDRIEKQWQAIKVDGKVVGHYWQDIRPPVMSGRLARTIGTSIIQAMIIGLIITSLISLFLGLMLTRHFTKPLNRLMEAVQRVGDGDLSSRVDVKGNGDIALLARDFNRMTEQLTRNEEVRRNMVADIAHELRTPLAVILGKLESIQEGVLPSTPETILPIQDETLRLIRLVRDLQQLSLAEAGKLPMTLRKVSLRTIVERIAEQFAIEFEERKLHLDIIGNAPEIVADTDRLTQVFVNLIGNALLHTPPGGSLRVVLEEVESSQDNGPNNEDATRRLRDVFRRKEDKTEEMGSKEKNNVDDFKSQKWARVTVEDSGEGIPEEELEHIFDRFYRVDKSRERENGGTGLGLAIAKEFIQAHGGTIRVDSKIGVGSSFRIILPEKPKAAIDVNP